MLLSDGEDTLHRPGCSGPARVDRGGPHLSDRHRQPAGTVLQINGFSVATALDEHALKKIASVTNAKYYNAQDTATLAQIYKNIDSEGHRPEEDGGDRAVRGRQHPPAPRRRGAVARVVREVGVAMSFATPLALPALLFVPLLLAGYLWQLRAAQAC